MLKSTLMGGSDWLLGGDLVGGSGGLLWLAGLTVGSGGLFNGLDRCGVFI